MWTTHRNIYEFVDIVFTKTFEEWLVLRLKSFSSIAFHFAHSSFGIYHTIYHCNTQSLCYRYLLIQQLVLTLLFM
jgi:hypothetical protein